MVCALRYELGCRPIAMQEKIYQCSLEVRGYELDSFGHVNHAVYVSYLEHARWKLLAEEKIGLNEFQTWKAWPVIAKIEVSYLKPAFMGETLTVHTKILKSGRTSFIGEQNILRGETPVLKAQVHVVMVNEKGRPTELPAEMSHLWQNPQN
jgi:YbgC/YbaW family acyl-CoA thioester hydrolase